MSSNIYKYELPCIVVVATVRSKHMDTVILVRSLWVILFISMAIVDLKADNNTTTSQGNATSSSLAVAEIPSGGNGQVRNETAPSYTNQVVINNKNKHQGRGGSGGGGGGGGYSWGWGGGGGGGGGGRGREGGGGGGGGGWGWGGGGGGAGWWKWGCGGGKGRGGRSGSRNHHHYHRDHDHVYGGKRRFDEADYAVGEFAQCMRKGRCKGMRLDCPLHCGGPCYYDCQYMCKAHCKRRRS